MAENRAQPMLCITLLLIMQFCFLFNIYSMENCITKICYSLIQKNYTFQNGFICLLLCIYILLTIVKGYVD